MDTQEDPNEKLLLLQQQLDCGNRTIARLKRKLEKQINYSEELRIENETLNRRLNICNIDAFTQTENSYEASLKKDTNNIGNCQQMDTNEMKIPEEGEKTIEETLREAAEECLGATGYVYDEKTGLYYDYNSGYYYDPQNQLFYEPRSGVYYSYNSETREYLFHSRVDRQALQQQYDTMVLLSGAQHLPPTKTRESTTVTSKSKKNQPDSPSTSSKVDTEAPKKKEKRVLKKGDTEEIKEEKDIENISIGDESTEDGEITDSEPEEREEEEVVVEEEEEVQIISPGPIEETWPPCIRMMVLSSTCMTPGSLLVITCDGGTIGRDASLNHVVHLNDETLNKFHCEITYNEEEKAYFIVDKATQSGTFVNNKRISKAKRLSDPVHLRHGDILGLGVTRFLVHIHAGRETCDDCEPGQARAAIQREDDQFALEIQSLEVQPSKELNRRQKLNQIKSKYGLKNAHFQMSKRTDRISTRSGKYVDRASKRRIEVGSEDPSVVPPQAPASVHRPVSADNKGAKMLAKMGWKEGDSLGKSQEGIKEPINVQLRANPQAGLGSSSGAGVSLDAVQNVRHVQRWTQAQERYRKIEMEEEKQRLAKE